jgi:hypothetical protein
MTAEIAIMNKTAVVLATDSAVTIEQQEDKKIYNSAKKERVYRSMREFEERFFPKSLEDRLFETETDPAKLGIELARESLRKTGSQLN